MLTAKTGVSHGDDAHAAATEAATEARSLSLADTPPIAAIVLSSIKYDPESVLKAVRSVVGPNVPIVGCTTAGEITERGPASTNSVAVMVLYGKDVTAVTALGKAHDNLFNAGATVATNLKTAFDQAGASPEFVILFDDVLTGNGADIVRGVQSVMGTTFPIMGGAAGDDFNFEKTYQYFNNEVHSSSVVALSFYGDISYGVGVRHGWIPIGLPMTVTKSEGAVVHEIDHKPAIDTYKDYFGEEVTKEIETSILAETAITYPLGIKLPDSDEYLIRDPITVDEHGAITCAAEIPEGSEIRLMLGNKDEAIKNAQAAAEQSVESLGKRPQAAIIFNCIARNKLFAQHSPDEIKAIQAAVGEIPLIGFYTYGEQAPLKTESAHIKQCEASFHNETVVIVTLA